MLQSALLCTILSILVNSDYMFKQIEAHRLGCIGGLRKRKVTKRRRTRLPDSLGLYRGLGSLCTDLIHGHLPLLLRLSWRRQGAPRGSGGGRRKFVGLRL